MKPVWEYAEDQKQINAVLLIGRQWLPITVGSWVVREGGDAVAFQTKEGNAFVKGSAVLGVREAPQYEWSPWTSEPLDDYDRIFNTEYSFEAQPPRFTQ